ncbi:hypothetical protein V5799_002917 [Amblyomma americanum]|uniref:Uncharacterized protein n=1 Tax=Amblyomma americanum TaxID=6943 RepID=A0AAQ4DAG1_AMBAM
MSETYSQTAKINTPYTRDNFLHNLVLHARSQTRDSALWSPFRHFATLAPLGSVVHDRRAYMVIGPMYLMEDFFYADATEPSLNLATLGGHVASEIRKAMRGYDAPALLEWIRKVTHAYSYKILKG